MSDAASQITMIERDLARTDHKLEQHHELLFGIVSPPGMVERVRRLEAAERDRVRNRRWQAALFVALVGNVVAILAERLCALWGRF